MESISKDSINLIISEFENKTLKIENWTHQAHIIVAFWHNKNFDFETAVNLLRNKIKAYNLSVGTQNSDNSGYHETLTIFWMILTKDFLSTNNSLQFEKKCNIFLNSIKSSKDYPLNYYSKEKLSSKKARKEYIEPDLKPMK